jgi:adenylate cyclase
MRGVKRSLFECFADPALERRYRIEQRSRQAWSTSPMLYIAAAGVTIFWAVNFALLPFADAWAIARGQTSVPIVMVIHASIVRRPVYAQSWWADIVFFVCIQPGMYLSTKAIVAAGVANWTLNAGLCYAMQLVLAFACLTFAAKVRPFFYLTLASVGYLALVLMLLGYPPLVVLYTSQNYAFFALVLFYLNWAIDNKARSLFAARISLDAERQRSERLLDNMLPGSIAERLKARERIADAFADVVVVFVDLVGFTALSQRLGPARIVALLDAYFARADHGCDLFQMEKVKTIGDAYMAMAGALTRPPRPAKAAIDYAIWLRGEARAAGREFGVELRLHVGIAAGPAIGGVTGAKRLNYDYWGHTVNLAARLQDSVGTDGIAVSEPVWRETRDSYGFADPRTVALKGIGAVEVYDLVT